MIALPLDAFESTKFFLFRSLFLKFQMCDHCRKYCELFPQFSIRCPYFATCEMNSFDVDPERRKENRDDASAVGAVISTSFNLYFITASKQDLMTIDVTMAWCGNFSWPFWYLWISCGPSVVVQNFWSVFIENPVISFACFMFLYSWNPLLQKYSR